MGEKLKSFLQNDQHFFGLLVVLVAISAFFLGRASLGEGSRVPIEPATNITAAKSAPVQATEPIVSATTSAGSTFEVVASKSGTKYHRPDCPGAIQIKPTNIIRFPSPAAAGAAGYTPAANCPGLE